MAQPLQHRGKEMGTTLPAPLKPEHGGRENRGEKRQQLGAEPASSWGERLEKDRVCIVPWGSHCPTLPDTLLTPFLLLRTALPPPAGTLIPTQHSSDSTLRPLSLVGHMGMGLVEPQQGTARAVPGLTSASSLVNPKSSRKKMRTKTKGTAQLHGWVMGLTPHSLYPTPVPWPAPSALPQAVAFSPPTSFSQTSSPVEWDWGSARTE